MGGNKFSTFGFFTQLTYNQVYSPDKINIQIQVFILPHSF